MYGVAIAAAGMMATTAMQLAIDAFGPIADNAGGIAEMSGLPKEVREPTTTWTCGGNTTAATGEGFRKITFAALTALALFAAYVGMSGITGHRHASKPMYWPCCWSAGCDTFSFGGLTIRAVGKHSGHGSGEGSTSPVRGNCQGSHGRKRPSRSCEVCGHRTGKRPSVR